MSKIKIHAEYNYLFEKQELVYIDDPILKIKGLATIINTCYLDRLPDSELLYTWSYDKPFPQILVHFEYEKNSKQNVMYPCDEFKYIFKLKQSTN